jgi:putative ABC transport system substrate-binding protein
LTAKRLELLLEVVPKPAMAALLMNPTFVNAEYERMELMTAAGALGRKVQVLSASTESGIDAAFATLVQEGARALLLGNDPFFHAPPSTRGTGSTPRDPVDLSASRVRGGGWPAELRN